MLRIPRFSVLELMLCVAVVACCVLATRVLGLVLCTFLAFLVSCYAVAFALPTRARATCGALCAMFAVLPWLGLGRGALVLMGEPDRLLPTIELPEGVHGSLAWMYWIAETPLYVISEYSQEFAEFICFAGEGLVTVRPLVVFVFWAGLSLTFALSLSSAFYTRHDTLPKMPPNIESPSRQSEN